MLKNNKTRIGRYEERACEPCGQDTEHHVLRVGMERKLGFYIVINSCECQSCKSVFGERKMILPR